jgi:hypothetical protein
MPVPPFNAADSNLIRAAPTTESLTAAAISQKRVTHEPEKNI